MTTTQITDIIGYAYTDLQIVLCHHCDAHDTDLHQRTDRHSITVSESSEMNDWCYECDTDARYWIGDPQ